MEQRHLFLAFFRAGMLGYGGGLSAIPLMQHEVVKKYKWMNNEEFSDVLALANTLPGPINTKLAGYIGYRIGGTWGLINSIIASVLPTALLMVLLLTVLNAYKDKDWVQGMAKGVLPVAGVMIGVLAWDFIRIANLTMGLLTTLILTTMSIVIMVILDIHPAILIVVLIGIALLSRDKEGKSKKQQVDGQ